MVAGGALSYSTIYYWQVRASNEGGPSDWSTVRSFATEAEPVSLPASPQGLNANAEGSSISLSWSANNESDLAGYKLFRGTQSNPTELLADVGNVTAYQDEDVSSGQTYYYRLKAYDTEGNSSDYSAEVNARISSNPITLSLPELTIDESETAFVEVQTSDLSGRGVYSYDFTLSYDPAIIEISSVNITGALLRRGKH
ncbi:MAG: hypothetical protein U5K69_04195 [Balneolaceae bacterium]|nr:hypothetical protein [Balneolaceae bacterium]